MRIRGTGHGGLLVGAAKDSRRIQKKERRPSLPYSVGDAARKEFGLICFLFGQAPGRRSDGVSNGVAVFCTVGELGVQQAGGVRRSSRRGCRSEHSQRVRQFSVGAAVRFQGLRNRTQISDGGIFGGVHVGLLHCLAIAGTSSIISPTDKASSFPLHAPNRF